MINIKNFDPNNIKVDEKLYENIFIYYIAYVTIADSKYVKFNSVNTFYLTFIKMKWYFEEINGNKYLMVVPTNESKEKIKIYEELWSKIREVKMQIEKALINDRLRVSKISWTFHVSTIYSFAVIYLWNLLFS